MAANTSQTDPAIKPIENGDGLNPAASVKSHSYLPPKCLPRGSTRIYKLKLQIHTSLQTPKVRREVLWCSKRFPEHINPIPASGIKS